MAFNRASFTINHADRYLNVKQVADILGLTQRTVEQYIGEGAITATRIGLPGKRPNVRISPADLKAFLAKGTQRRPYQYSDKPNNDDSLTSAQGASL